MSEKFGGLTTTPMNPEMFGGSGGGSITVDQTYNAESKNAQSGKAVAQAVAPFEYLRKSESGYTFFDGIQVRGAANIEGVLYAQDIYGFCNEPEDSRNIANKQYVDDALVNYDESLTKFKETVNVVDDLLVSENLYNKEKDTVNTVINTSGVEVANAEYSVSEFIKIKAGDYWGSNGTATTKSIGYIAQYDLNKEFIKRIGTSSVNVVTFEEDCYVRLCVRNLYKDSAMFMSGTEGSSVYIPYQLKIQTEVKDGSVDVRKTNFIKTHGNLINHRTIEEGYKLSTSGVKEATGEYSITQKIYLKPNTKYTAQYVTRIVYFDENDNYIKRTESSGQVYTLTTPSAFSYAILTLTNNVKYNKKWKLVEGENIGDFERQYITVDGYRIYDNELVSEETPLLTKFINWDKVCVDKESVFSLPSDKDTIPSDQRGVADILSKYDNLMSANPLYITKTELGIASDGTSTIYRYDFNEPEPPHSTSYVSKKPKIILISGVHPEFSGIYGLYYALEQITNNPDLIDVRRNTHFIVVPVTNPYACNTHSRKNANGVDIARNFEIGFEVETDTSSDTYGGEYALSEVESQYIDAIMAENTDAILFSSCHSFQGSGTSAIWGACATNYTVNLTTKVIDKLSRYWREKYDFIPNEPNVFLGSCEKSAPKGSEGRQACKYGIQGLTFEVCDYFRYNTETDAHSGFVYSRSAESYINFIKVALGCWESSDIKIK